MDDKTSTTEDLTEALKDKKKVTKKELEEIVQKLLTESIKKQYEFIKIIEALGDDPTNNNLIEERVEII